MEYQALYRRYRPQRFAELVGQQHVSETLRREILDGSVAHAYLFTGPRGTGKTTTARILAKALNCPDRTAEGEPCNVCESCAAIGEGSSMDVVELDAASHNSVDDIREIRTNVTAMAWAGGAKRVFILDEAHMLSKAAGNALLKTLEEPPEHVHFVLATTEPYKLLDTIRSRTQRFDFHPVPVEILADHLAAIVEAESLTADRAALVEVARHARGSVRDALSLLEQVAALGAGTVDVAGVRRALGLADREVFERLADAIVEEDGRLGLELVAALAADGVDLRRFLSEAVGFLRGVFLAHYAPNLAEVADEPEDVLERWRRGAKRLAPTTVLRAIDVLSDALLRVREGREERLMVELAILKITRPELAFDADALRVRIDGLESQVKRLLAARREDAIAAPASPEPTTSAAPQPDASVPGQVSAGPSERPASESDAPSGADASVGTPSGGVEAEAPFVGEAAASSAASAPTMAEAPPMSDAAATVPPVSDDQGGEATTDADASTEVPPAGEAAAPIVAGGGEALTLERFEAIWPALVATVRDELGARRQALFREARPAAVEGSTLVLAVPADLEFHLAQLQADEPLHQVVARRASALLGDAIVRVEFRAENGRARPAEETPERVPDKDRLRPADEDIADPTRLVLDELGGTVIEEDDEA